MNVLTAAILARTGDGTGSGSMLISIPLLALSFSSFYCGGMCLNDIFDREWDAEHQPFRPIPSGRVSLEVAWRIAGSLFALGLGLLLLAPHPSAVIPGALLLFLIFFYDRYHKQISTSVVIMSGTRAMVYFTTAWAVAGTFSLMIYVAALAQFLYTLLVSAVARHENTRGIPYSFPLIPRMLAGMPIVDGAILSLLFGPAWMIPGILAALATHLGQHYVRGD